MSDLATIEDLAAARSVEADPSDLRAVRSLQAASDTVRSTLGYDPAYVTGDIVTVNGSGVASQNIPLRGLLEVTSVTFDEGTTWEYVLPADRYRFTEGGVLYLTTYGDCWPVGYGNVSVLCDHGYNMPGVEPIDDVPALPAGIREVTVEIAASLYQLSAIAAVSSETIGNYSYDTGGQAAIEPGYLAATRLVPYRANDTA